jgi:DnaK suppressor protein
MDSLTPKQEKELLHALLKLANELKEQLEINKQATEVVQLDQTLVGRVSRIDALQQQSMAVSTREKARLKLKKVQHALNAMESGDYGYCRQCDEFISFGRLNAQPEASLCLPCQDNADQQS